MRSTRLEGRRLDETAALDCGRGRIREEEAKKQHKEIRRATLLPQAVVDASGSCDGVKRLVVPVGRIGDAVPLGRISWRRGWEDKVSACGTGGGKGHGELAGMAVKGIVRGVEQDEHLLYVNAKGPGLLVHLLPHHSLAAVLFLVDFQSCFGWLGGE